MNDQTLTEAEIADLRCLAGMIIPASAQYDVPGADKPEGAGPGSTIPSKLPPWPPPGRVRARNALVIDFREES